MFKIKRKGKKYYLVGRNSEVGSWKSYSGAYKALRKLQRRV